MNRDLARSTNSITRPGLITLALAASIASSLVSSWGCASRPAAESPAATPATLTLPEHAATNPAIAPLSFMAGRWIAVNPNKTINEEHWTAPRGNNMAAMFKQIRRDGTPAFFEVSLITAEETGVFLRLRHLHRQLEVPKGREEVSLFRLVSAADNRAEFTGTGAAAAVTSVVYRLDGPDTLVAEVNFAPDSGERGYSTRYVRESLAK